MALPDWQRMCSGCGYVFPARDTLQGRCNECHEEWAETVLEDHDRRVRESTEKFE